MSRLIVSSLQAAVLSGTSNVLAQALTSYHEDTPFSINFAPILQFILFSLLSTPPNVLWQEWLERKFPGTKPQPALKHKDRDPGNRPVASKVEEIEKHTANAGKSLDLKNTAMKFLLDQTLGASVNNVLFLVGLALIRGHSWDFATNEVSTKFWDLQFAAYRLWPLVSILNFTLVPVDKRVLFGNMVGLCWGVFLSLKAGK